MGASLEGRGRRCWRQQHINTLEGRIKIPPDQGAHLLRLFVIGIDISGGQGVGADQDSPLHLSAESFSTASRRHRGKALGVFGTEAVFDTVVPRQVGRRLRWCDHVVGGDAVVEPGAAHLHQFSTESLQLGSRGLHRCLHLRIEAFGIEALLDHPHLQALDGLVEAGAEIGNRCIKAGGIAGVGPGDHLEQFGHISNAAGEGSHLIQRAGEGHQAPTADAAVGGLEAHHTTERRRLADGTTGVGTKRSDATAGSDGRCTATGASTRHMGGVPGVLCGTERGRFG